MGYFQGQEAGNVFRYLFSLTIRYLINYTKYRKEELLMRTLKSTPKADG